MRESSVTPLTGKIQKNIPLALYTTFKIGGSADYFVIVGNKTQLKEALEWALSKNIPFNILGNGSNVLVSDAGWRGLIIRIKNQELRIKNHSIMASAGINLPFLAKESAQNGLTGLEFGINVPGTVGGAIYGNAGSFGQDIGNLVKSVTIYEIIEQKIIEKKITHAKCKFEYRNSIFKQQKNWVIIEAKLELAQDTPEKCQQRINETLQNKKERQPSNQKCAGSIFKNPPGYSAWELISEVEMKGKQIGGAQVSNIHANYIINTGTATAEHIIMLVAMIKQRVRDRLGIQLQEEIQYIGF